MYRSNRFALRDIIGLELYYGTQDIPNENGMTQDQIDNQIRDARGSIENVESLSASIRNKKIAVRGEGRGAEVRFDIKLSSSTGSNLDKFVKHKIENLDIDLPGPDFITGLCVNEDDIEQQISRSVRSLVSQMNSQILDEIIQLIADESGLDRRLIEIYFDNFLTMTFGNFNYPVVETRRIGIIPIRKRAIVPVPYLGFPRNIG